MLIATRKIGTLVSRVLLAGSLATFAILGFGPRLGAYRTLTVLTGSMSPSIPAGSIVVATPIPAYAIQPGDIIVYQAPTQDRHVVMHRVVQARQMNGSIVIHTKGDANQSQDPWAAAITDRVAWKVRTAVPFAGRVLVALRSRPAHLLLVLVLPFGLAAGWMRKIWSNPRPRESRVVPG